MLDQFAPPIVHRSLMFLERPKTVKGPIDYTKRVPNFFSVMERVVIETYPSFSSLKEEWGEESNRGALIACVIMVCVHPKHTLQVFKLELLNSIDVDVICAFLEKQDEKGFLRSRIAKGQIDKARVIELIRRFGCATVPNPTTLSQMRAWLEKNGCGVGPWMSLMIAREMRLFGYFAYDEAVQLCKGKGPAKFLVENGITDFESAIRDMQGSFSDAMKKEWESNWKEKYNQHEEAICTVRSR